jgi:hypothetical protein
MKRAPGGHESGYTLSGARRIDAFVVVPIAQAQPKTIDQHTVLAINRLRRGVTVLGG